MNLISYERVVPDWVLSKRGKLGYILKLLIHRWIDNPFWCWHMLDIRKFINCFGQFGFISFVFQDEAIFTVTFILCDQWDILPCEIKKQVLCIAFIPLIGLSVHTWYTLLKEGTQYFTCTSYYPANDCAWAQWGLPYGRNMLL